MWQEQAIINSNFEKNFKIGYNFTDGEMEYQICGIGYTHLICSNESHLGNDLFISKIEFLKKYLGVNYESKTRICQ